MRILFASSECAPWVKTGGLADVAGALVPALNRLGADVHLLLPAYPAVRAALPGAADGETYARIEAVAGLPAAIVRRTVTDAGTTVLLLDCPALFDRPGNPYLGPDGRDWPDNDLRFALFSRAAALLAAGAVGPDGGYELLHCNDWQSGLAPVYLRFGFAPGGPVAGRRPASVITIHNLAYQGLFDPARLSALALPPQAFHIDGVEFYGRLSFLKGALACADAITTVSPTYAREILGEALGFGLQGLLASRSGVLTGILNGIDTQEWDPAFDPHIPHRYDEHRLANKALCKRRLQDEFGLPQREDVPLFGMVSRLVPQKGGDLVADIAADLARLPAQLIVLGSGDAALEARLRSLEQAHPDSIRVRIGFDEGAAHRIEAGIDLFLMPSRFEPCGLNQMYSQRYGTPPIVCATGGLADSVVDCNSATLQARTASGFVFQPAQAGPLLGAIGRAVALFHDRAHWQALQRNAMSKDFSWERSARRYLDVYGVAAPRGAAGGSHP